MKVVTFMNYMEEPYLGELNGMPSETVPDQAMTVREIMERFSRGLPLGGMRIPEYDEDDDMPDIRRLDLAERQELRERYEFELKTIRNDKDRKRRSVLETVPEPAGQKVEGDSKEAPSAVKPV